MSDHSQTFMQLCASIAQALQAANRPPLTYQASDDAAHGWLVSYESRTDERGNVGQLGGWWETCRVTNEVFLTTEGKLMTRYRELYEGTDHMQHPSGHLATDRIQPASQSVNLVGERGKPYGEWSAKLQRIAP